MLGHVRDIPRYKSEDFCWLKKERSDSRQRSDAWWTTQCFGGSIQKGSYSTAMNARDDLGDEAMNKTGPSDHGFLAT